MCGSCLLQLTPVCNCCSFYLFQDIASDLRKWYVAVILFKNLKMLFVYFFLTSIGIHFVLLFFSLADMIPGQPYFLQRVCFISYLRLCNQILVKIIQHKRPNTIILLLHYYNLLSFCYFYPSMNFKTNTNYPNTPTHD